MSRRGSTYQVRGEIIRETIPVICLCQGNQEKDDVTQVPKHSSVVESDEIIQAGCEESTHPGDRPFLARFPIYMACRYAPAFSSCSCGIDQPCDCPALQVSASSGPEVV